MAVVGGEVMGVVVAVVERAAGADAGAAGGSADEGELRNLWETGARSKDQEDRRREVGGARVSGMGGGGNRLAKGMRVGAGMGCTWVRV